MVNDNQNKWTNNKIILLNYINYLIQRHSNIWFELNQFQKSDDNYHIRYANLNGNV